MHKYLRQIKNNETSVTIAKCSISLSTLAHLTRAVVHPDDKFNESPDSSIPASFFNDFKGPPVAAGHFSCSTGAQASCQTIKMELLDSPVPVTGENV